MIYAHEPMVSGGSTESAQAARVFRPGRLFTHLMADTEQELIDYAESLGMRPEWLQYSGTYRAHFDVMGTKLKAVMKDPTVKILTRREFGQFLIARRASWKEKHGE